MRRDRSLLLAIGAAAGGALLLIALFALGAATLVWTTLSADERASLGALLAPRAALPILVALAVAGAAAAAARPLHRRWIASAARLLEQARVLTTTDVQRELGAPGGAPAVQGLAQVINDLARQRDQLRSDIAREVAQASRGIEKERNRLAALMSELTQSVVV